MVSVERIGITGSRPRPSPSPSGNLTRPRSVRKSMRTRPVLRRRNRFWRHWLGRICSTSLSTVLVIG